MSFRADPGARGVKITKNPYGASIEIQDRNPNTRFLPPDPEELRRAVKNAETVTEMPKANRR
jgi:hypothetical protein